MSYLLGIPAYYINRRASSNNAITLSTVRHIEKVTGMSKWKQIAFTLLLVYITLVAINQSISVNAESHDEYKGAEYCVTCHSKQVGEHAESMHNIGYSNENFQEVWTDLGSSNDCLECHTTGYDKATETYYQTGVQCEACHGPGDTMNRDTSPELCGVCHTGPYPTYDEWVVGGPSHGSADCITCHNEHTSKMEFETPDETCGQCHDSHVTQVDESTHGLNDVGCVECHMNVEDADFYNGVQAKTGHSFNPTEHELDCTSCHDVILEKHDVLGEKAQACLSCHGDIHELKLELVNRKTYDNDDPVPLCAQCHNERYTDWSLGTHGAHDDSQAVCTECHDPHIPIINKISTLESIPAREFDDPAPTSYKLAFVGVLLVFAFSVWSLRRNSSD